jgi:hypothetical protein
MRTSFLSAPGSLGRLVLVCARLAAVVCLGATTVACGPPPAPPKVESAEDRAEKDKFKKAKALIDKANVAYGDKDFDKARKFLREASEVGVESLSFQIKEETEKVDKRHAKLWANELEEPLKEGDCKGVFSQLASPMQDLESDVFNKEVRRLIGTELVTCLQGKIEAATGAAKFAEARALMMHGDTKTVLGAPAHKKMLAALEASILETLKAGIAEPISAKKWDEAVRVAEEAVKKGDTNAEGGKALFQMVRDALAPEVAGLAHRNVGQRDAAKALTDVDALIKLAKWEVEGGAKENAAPELVIRKRQALTTWIESQRLKMKPEKKPEKRFAHGKVKVLPAGNTETPSKRDLTPAMPVWIIGRTKDLALITEVDPGTASAEALFEKAIGWAPLARLATKNTAEWLPPDDQIAGLRVWAPLRADEPNLELGTVASIKGQDVVVKRLADDKEITVKKSTLRLGRIVPGMKILNSCQAKMQVTIVEELMLDQRTVKLICEGGLRKDEVLQGLRVRPEDLPVPKQ